MKVPSFPWDEMRRLSPVSKNYGRDRGQAIDRYYIEEFLNRYQGDIRGRVLEVQSSGYTVQFSGERAHEKCVLDIDPNNKDASIFADLADASSIPSDSFDCFILTQTVQYIFDVHSALYHATRILKPSGVLLATLPSVSRVDPAASEIDYWRFTEAAVRRLFELFYPKDNFSLSVFGNVLVDMAFLTGLASHELTRNELDYADPFFPLLICVRAVKSASQQK